MRVKPTPYYFDLAVMSRDEHIFTFLLRTSDRTTTSRFSVLHIVINMMKSIIFVLVVNQISNVRV